MAMKTMMCAVVLIALLLVGSIEASCIVKNESSKDIILIPVIDVNVNIFVKVGDVVEVPSKYKDCHVKNLGNGARSEPVGMSDGSVTVVVDGNIEGTVKLLVGVFVDGVIAISANAFVLVQI